LCSPDLSLAQENKPQTAPPHTLPQCRLSPPCYQRAPASSALPAASAPLSTAPSFTRSKGPPAPVPLPAHREQQPPQLLARREPEASCRRAAALWAGLRGEDGHRRERGEDEGGEPSSPHAAERRHNWQCACAAPPTSPRLPSPSAFLTTCACAGVTRPPSLSRPSASLRLCACAVPPTSRLPPSPGECLTACARAVLPTRERAAAPREGLR